MKQEYTLGLYEKSMPATLSWEEKLLEAKEAGFDFVEISIDETEEKLERLSMSKDERNRLLFLMRKTEMPIRTMCLSGHRKYPLGSHDPEVRRKAIEIIEKAIELADDIGIRVIQLAGYDVYYEEPDQETRKYFQKNLKKAVNMAERSGIMLGFETMETEFMNTVKKAMEYVKIADSAYLGIYPDIGNLTNAAISHKTDVLEDISFGKGHLLGLHLKETLPGKFREVPFGYGHVDFEVAIAKAWKLGIRRFVTEFWYTGNEDWRSDLKTAKNRFTEILDCQERADEEA